MEPIKIKLYKRSRAGPNCNDYEAHIPEKKRKNGALEKENEESGYKNTPSCNVKAKSGRAVLTEAPLPCIKKDSEDLNSDAVSEESDDQDMHEMLLQLKKSGIRTINNSKNFSGVKTKKVLSDQKVLKKSSESDNNTPVKKRNIKKKLIDEFENLNNINVTQKRSTRSKSVVQVPELDKLPEDLILHYKRTSKQVKRLELANTPEIVKSDETPKRSSSRQKIIPEQGVIDNEEAVPNQKSLRTPKRSSAGKKKIISVSTTPTCRNENKLPTTPLEKAWMKLHAAATFHGLPCREKEYKNIFSFVKNKLWDEIGGCMYISGVPGTGKTATVNQVLEDLKQLAQKGEVPDFKCVQLNGMRLSDPRQAYVKIWQKLFGKEEKIPPDRAQKFLDDLFSKNNIKKKPIVLLVDELDLIYTKKQDVVYNILDWPTRTYSRLVVLTIANTMDMPERLFKGRITSRMGLTRMTFLPYTFKQLEEIVSARLKGLEAFLPDAVQLVTRKVAAVSGDARRALDICRRAAEIPGPNDIVKINHIEQAIKEITNSNIVKAIRNCSKMEKLFLRSLCDVSFRSNVEEVDLMKVIDQLLCMCVLEGINRPSVSSILIVSNNLKCSRLILADQSHTGILQRVMLNVTQDDIHYAMQT